MLSVAGEFLSAISPGGHSYILAAAMFLVPLAGWRISWAAGRYPAAGIGLFCIASPLRASRSAGFVVSGIQGRRSMIFDELHILIDLSRRGKGARPGNQHGRGLYGAFPGSGFRGDPHSAMGLAEHIPGQCFFGPHTSGPDHPGTQG